MTSLRDDGFLETDSSIVAACFLGRKTDDGRYIVAVNDDCWDDGVKLSRAYPILIPAATVAEVWGDQPGMRLRHGVILAALDETNHDDDIHETVLHWMAEHTEEE